MNNHRNLIRICFSLEAMDAESMSIMLDAMPDNTKILDIEPYWSRGFYTMVLEHPDFPSVPEGTMCPEAIATFKRLGDGSPDYGLDVSFTLDSKPWNPCEKEDERWSISMDDATRIVKQVNNDTMNYGEVEKRIMGKFEPTELAVKRRTQEEKAKELMELYTSKFKIETINDGKQFKITAPHGDTLGTSLRNKGLRPTTHVLDKPLPENMSIGYKIRRFSSSEPAIQSIPREDTNPTECNCNYEGWKFHTKDCPAKKTGPCR